MARIRFREFAHVDALRAAAVLLVVFSHAGLVWLPGGAGVTIFFVISGFIISHLLFLEHERTGAFRASGFYSRRAWKLAPPLFVIVVIPTIIYSFFSRIDPVAFGSQILFGYNWVSILNPDAADQVLPGSGVTWSLAIEEQFYISLALLWMLLAAKREPGRHLWWVVAGTTVTATAWRVAVALMGASELRIERGTDTRVDAIATGVMVALVFAKWRKGHWLRLQSLVGKSPVVVCAAGLAFVASLVFRDEFFQSTFKYTIQQVSVAVVILYGIVPAFGRFGRFFLAVAAWKPIQIVGLASYSIYLVHLPLKYLLEAWWEDGAATFGVISWQLLVGASGTVAGLAVWRLVEVPIEAYRHKVRAARSVA